MCRSVPSWPTSFRNRSTRWWWSTEVVPPLWSRVSAPSSTCPPVCFTASPRCWRGASSSKTESNATVTDTRVICRQLTVKWQTSLEANFSSQYELLCMFSIKTLSGLFAISCAGSGPRHTKPTSNNYGDTNVALPHVACPSFTWTHRHDYSSIQLACMICSCVIGNSSPYHQAWCIHHSSLRTFGYTSYCYD